jgi:WhiB family redox-sensing transcriptional regulator
LYFQIPKEEDWRQQSACAKVDPNIFFPLKITSTSVKQALVYCKTCPVRIECAQTAVIYDYDGIWGGTTLAQRNYFMRTHFKGALNKFSYQDSVQMLSSVNFVPVTVRSSRRKRTKISNEG